MSAAPQYATTPAVWPGLVNVATADTSFQAPSHGITLGSALNNGTKITQVDVIPAGTVVAALVTLFLYDGATYHLHEAIPVAAYTASTTGAPPKTTYTYDNLVLPSGWSLYATSTVASNPVEVNAYGASL